MRSVAELPDEQLSLVVDAWQRRRKAEPHGYLHALINEGKAAGGSLLHSHSQLVWFTEPPPALTSEHNLETALETERVLERDSVVAVLPHAGRVPYEALIAPTEPEDDVWASNRLATALQLLAEYVRRLHAIGGGAIPLNAWLHAGPWWHIEVFPRLTILAGIELGAGIYVNTVAPEEAAQQLKDTAS